MKTILLTALLSTASLAAQPSKESPKPNAQSRPQAEKPPHLLPRPKSAEELFRNFHKMAGLEASFVEEKHLALLAVPLKSTGKLYFQPPGYLCRQVLKPQKSTVVITPKELRVEHGDSKKPKEVIDLRASAEVRNFVTSLVQVFRGDTKTLTKTYRMKFAADKSHARRWHLELKPKGAPLDKMMRNLTLHGEGHAVTSIEIVEPKGDRTVTHIKRANPKRKFTATEKRRFFGIIPTRKKAK